jgi:lipopolysaccharide biosynthesis protein
MRWLFFFRLRNVIKIGFAILWMYAAAGIAVFRGRRHFILERIEGDRDLTGAKRVAIFVHYDRRGRVHDYVLNYLSNLRGAGFELVFMSNAPSLSAEAKIKLQPLCALIMRRRNIGYDFGAYSDGIAAVDNVADLDELLLVNDSVYGPFEDLSKVVLRCDPARAAVWGITDNWYRRYHLQSYFLLFKKAALSSEAFARFWHRVRHVQSKRWIIEKYEIGLSQSLLQNGLRCAALYPYRRVTEALANAVEAMEEEREREEDEAETRNERPRRRRLNEQQRFAADMLNAVAHGIPLNSTHHLWDYLIAELGCPFLKRELLERNPVGVPALQRWEIMLRERFDYDTDLIVRHLEMRMRNRAV